MGLTVDDITSYPQWPDLARRLTGPFGWVRIVFDPTVDRGNAEHHRAAVNAAHRKGLKVLGQPLDSAFAKSHTRAQYKARIAKFVDAYPDIEAWEIANCCRSSKLRT